MKTVSPSDYPQEKGMKGHLMKGYFQKGLLQLKVYDVATNAATCVLNENNYREKLQSRTYAFRSPVKDRVTIYIDFTK